jgi:hypothetical protein
MALVHDNEVEEVGRELLVDVLLFLGSGDGLIKAQVDLECFIDRSIGDLGHCLPERFEVVRFGLVGQDVSIHEEEDAFFC